MIDLDCLCLQEYLTHNHSKSRSLWLAFCEDITAIRNIGITHLWRVEPIDSVDCSGYAFRCEVSALLLRNSNPGIPTYFIQMTRVRLSVFLSILRRTNDLGRHVRLGGYGFCYRYPITAARLRLFDVFWLKNIFNYKMLRLAS